MAVGGFEIGPDPSHPEGDDEISLAGSSPVSPAKCRPTIMSLTFPWPSTNTTHYHALAS